VTVASLQKLVLAGGLVLALPTVPPTPLTAQMPAGHVMEMIDEVAPETLPPPRKMNGVGTVKLTITATPEAQAWFNQGLNLIHDFWEYESARAFQQSVRVDPNCAMCYWGLFKALAFYHSTSQGYAKQALDKAVSLQDRVTERERLYIQATAAPYEASRELWRKLATSYPDDIEAKIFFAQSLPAQESLAMLEEVIRLNPDNSAAHHIYIHALEAGPNHRKALPSAERLARLAPASGHMVHMPGHIYFRIGDYAEAAKFFSKSIDVDERYMREQRVTADQNWNYVHNLMFAIANAMEAGKLADATKLSAKLRNARGVLDTTVYSYSTRDAMTRIAPELPVAIRTANWAHVLELLGRQAPPPGRPNLEFLAKQLATFAGGMREVDARNFAAATDAADRLDAELARPLGGTDLQAGAGRRMAQPPAPASSGPSTPLRAGRPQQRVSPDAQLPAILNTLSIMALELRASLLTAQGKTSEAAALFTQASEKERALGYREPPTYLRPVREAEAAALMAAGEWHGAHAAYEQALQARPRSGFSLYGLALSSEKAGNVTAATKEFRDFLAAWDDADRQLPEVRHARDFLAKRR
jgi:tetratricopeptide (TPR) repeat protein